MTSHQLCLGHHRGVSACAEAPMFPSIAHTEHRVRSLRRVVGRPNVPPLPDPLPGIWPVSTGIWLLSKLSFRALTLLVVRTPIGRFYLGHAIKTRSPRSESISPVEQPSSCDTGHNAWLATKGSVQQSSVDRPVYSELASVAPGPGTQYGARYPVLGSTEHTG